MTDTAVAPKRPAKMSREELRAVPVITAREAMALGAQFYEPDDFIHAAIDGDFYRFGRNREGTWFRWSA